LVRPSIRTIWQKIQNVLFSKNIKNSPLFRKNMGEEQKKRSSLIFPKNILLLLKNDLRNFGICFQLFTVIFENFRAILKNKDNMAPKAKDNMAKSQLSF
jgi:hypothetical protein